MPFNGTFVIMKNPQYNTYRKLLDKLVSNASSQSYNFQSLSPLAGGLSRAMLLANYHRYYEPNEKYLKLIHSDILQVSSKLGDRSLDLSFINGLSGFGWSISHFVNMNNVIELENGYFSEMDKAIYSYSIEALESNNYDLFYGAIGGVAYFIERYKNGDLDKKILPTLVKHLQKSAIETPDGIYWQSKNDVSNSSIDLSLPHGNSSILITLCKLYSLGISQEICSKLISASSNFIVSQREEFPDGYRIPDNITKEVKQFSPLRWCHGDLSIAYSLKLSGITTTDSKLIKVSDSIIALLSRLTDEKEEDVLSSTFCHGSLGIAHLFRQYHSLDGVNKQALEAAVYWEKVTLKFINSEIGYKYYDDDGKYRVKSGILTGIEGIGLTIIGLLNKKATEWHSCLSI